MVDSTAHAAKKAAPRSDANLDMFGPGRSPIAEVSNALLNLQRKDPKAFDNIMQQMSIAHRAQGEAYAQQSNADTIREQGLVDAHNLPPAERQPSTQDFLDNRAIQRGQSSGQIANEVRRASEMGHAINNPGMGEIDKVAGSILDLWKPEALQRFVNTFGMNSKDAVNDLWK